MEKLFRLLRISKLANDVRDLLIGVEDTLNIQVSDGFRKLLRLGIGALVLGHWIGWNIVTRKIQELFNWNPLELTSMQRELTSMEC